jgi:hypothetical protein
MLHTPTSKANQGSPSMAERDAGSWFLPTPRHEGFDAGSHRDALDSLHSYAKMFPSPQHHDHHTPGGPLWDEARRQEPERRSGGDAADSGSIGPQGQFAGRVSTGGNSPKS